MKKVLFVYHYIAHYREAVFLEIDSSKEVDITIFADDQDYTNQGIAQADTSKFENFYVAKCYKILGPLMWQEKIVSEALKGDKDYYVFLGNPYYLATWISALVLIVKRKPFAFWTIGWFRKSNFFVDFVKRFFFSLPEKVFVYNSFNKKKVQDGGWPSNKNVAVVYNSVSLSSCFDVSSRTNQDPRDNISGLNPGYLICVTRLLKKRGLDLLLKSIAEIKKSGNFDFEPEVLIVGEGEEKDRLVALAKELGVKAKFWGACYDSSVLESLYRFASSTAAPSMIGLTAIQSLGYGCPVITHGDMYFQAPEAEAIIDGCTGYLFERGSQKGLIEAINRSHKDYIEIARRLTVARMCAKEASENWSADGQAKVILREVLK